jgi:FixJ family two-component response regulator
MNHTPFPLQRAQRLVVVIDDDEISRGELATLLIAKGMAVEAFGSAADAVQHTCAIRDAGCTLLNVDFAEGRGIEFLVHLRNSGVSSPTILVAAHADVRACVRAMKAGATDFLCKPCADESILKAVGAAFEVGRQRQDVERENISLSERYAALSPRQKQIMIYVVGGLMNKQIAHRVSLSEITVKVHRGDLMRRMQARSVAELVYMAHALDDHDGFGGVANRGRDFSHSIAI